MAQSNSLLFVFLFLLCSTLCVSVHADSVTRNGVVTADVFKSETEIKNVPTLTENNKINITPQNIQPPALFAATEDGVIVVIAETKYKINGASVGAGGEDKVDVVSRTFETTNQKNWPTEVFAKVDKTNWKTQLATENEKNTKDFSKIIASTVNKDRSKVYVFLLDITEQGGKKWNFRLVEGTFDSKTEGKTIKWEKDSFILTKDDEDIKTIFNGNAPESPLTDGSVFLTEEEGQVVFFF